VRRQAKLILYAGGLLLLTQNHMKLVLPSLCCRNEIAHNQVNLYMKFIVQILHDTVAMLCHYLRQGGLGRAVGPYYAYVCMSVCLNDNPRTKLHTTYLTRWFILTLSMSLSNFEKRRADEGRGYQAPEGLCSVLHKRAPSEGLQFREFQGQEKRMLLSWAVP